MNKEKLKQYNNWMIINYKNLQQYCKNYMIEEDYLNRAYILMCERIKRSGFTGNFYQTYIKRTINNLIINEKKKNNNNKYFIDFSNKDFENEINKMLNEIDESDSSTRRYREELIFFTKKLFIYIEGRYSDEQIFIFKTYYLVEGRPTYKKLTAMTGFNKSYLSQTIKTIKNDIKENFLLWIKNE